MNYQAILDRLKDEVAKENGFNDFTPVVFFAGRSDINAIASEAALRAMREVYEMMQGQADEANEIIGQLKSQVNKIA